MTSTDNGAFLVFANTGEVMQAENLLVREAMPVKVMAPPPALRTGCDMVLVIPLIHAFGAVALLEKNSLTPLQATAMGDKLLEPVSLFQIKDYGQWLMVRAANMKLTIEKASGRIVNVSGGGCPDVPWLAACLIGKSIYEAGLVREHGQTLCGYALHLAAVELRRLYKSGTQS
ncbi:DUF3343 domain-containing protein [Desulfovibrio sp. OttesenSCG-928-G15]|nr:DUF3343 domain-containing protein [Desulfovibrio sp. OttesenSCG-928-G15]